jgi:hypothetical protein
MPAKLAPERQRKNDLLVAATRERGLTLYQGYKGALTVGGGRWEVEVTPGRPGEQRPAGLATRHTLIISRATFDDLLALFTDDVTWAGYLYGRQVLGPAQEALRVASRTEYRQQREYADTCLDCRLYQWALDAGDDGYTVAGLTEAHNRIARAVVELRAAWETRREAARLVAELEAGTPTTPEAARTWLEEGCEYVTVPERD